MRKEAIKNNVVDIAKTTGKLLKTGYNTLSDSAEHSRQMAAIANMNQQAATAKSMASVPLIIQTSPQQFQQVRLTGLMTLDTSQENMVLNHRILEIKQNGGPTYDALVHQVLKEHYVNATRAYIDLRSRLGSKWILPECPQVRQGPSNGIVINSTLELRYKALVLSDMQDDLLKRLYTRWNTSLDVIDIQKEYGLQSYTAHFHQGILIIRLK